jgi:hypothetical protein
VPYRSADSTHVSVATLSWADVSAGAMIDNPTFTALSTQSCTASASSQLTYKTFTFTPAGAVATDRLYWKLLADTTALTGGATFDLISLEFKIGGDGGGGTVGATGATGATGPAATFNIGAAFDGGGSALTTGTKVYFTWASACTISAWNATVDTGTITFDIWKIATGTAIPTITNTIVASSSPAISTGTAKHSTTLTSWTTTVSANDIFAFNISAVASATRASLVLQCQ